MSDPDLHRLVDAFADVCISYTTGRRGGDYCHLYRLLPDRYTSFRQHLLRANTGSTLVSFLTYPA